VSQPAARVADLHVCPLSDPKPHVGGPIQPTGCLTVLIGGMPAARVGDTATCVSPVPDVIAPPGAPTVLIGGQPAARKDDLTLHGGSITSGDFTVLIGTAAVVSPPCMSDAKAAGAAGIQD
jgi:uncharacterized Zn-binding protein involved in type VI secretion